VIPFMAVYAPALMLQPGDPMAEAIGFWPAVAYVVGKAVLAIGLWGVATIGFLTGPLAWWERLWALLAAGLLVAALPLTDEIGFAGCLAFIAWAWWRHRRIATA
jgi:TRAP-type uncharacterized transport system fused permease subunit